MNYDKAAYTILLDYADLQEGEQRAGQLCPSCEGGTTKEKSLSVTRRNGVLLWNCHRSSCGLAGHDRSSTNAGESGSSTGAGRDRVYVKTTPLDKATAKFLSAKYSIPAEDFHLAGCGWTGEDAGRYSRRVSFPIFGPDSRKRGENYRSYEGAKPKALINLFSDEAVACSWYKWKRKSRTLVLVEDQVSAIKLAPHCHSMALLGTNLSEAKMLEILYNDEYDKIYLSLDADATKEAILTQLKWRVRFPSLMVLGNAGADIKDMDDSEFKNFLERLK